MIGHSLGIRTWKLAVLALALVANGACASDDDMAPGDSTNGKTHSSGSGGNGGNGGNAGAGGNAGGKATESPSSGDDCEDDSTILLPSAMAGIIGGMDVDADALYLSVGSSDSARDGIFRLPKTGGALEKIGDMDNLISGGPILVDGDDLYYGDSHLNRIKKDGSSAEPEVFFVAKGGISEITSDKDAIYFVHGIFCCESLDNDTTQHLMRMEKASGEVTEVVNAPSLASIAVDGDSVFWIGSFDKDDPDAGLLDDHPRALFRTTISARHSTVMVQGPKDLSGLNPGSGFGRGLDLTDSDVVFGSMNLNEYTAGIYRVAKTAANGTPVEITTSVSFSSGFVNGSAAYTSNGDAIDRVALDGGAITRVACGANPDSPTWLMIHDDANIYYVRHTKSKDGELGQELRSVPLPK